MSAAREFQAWPKIPRLNREVIVTEKIDGTNAAIVVTEDGDVYAQSRKRIITPDADNFGFAAWVDAWAAPLAVALGPGRHFGEWWGSGIQRGYGLTNGERRFSLFDTRWNDSDRLDEVLALGVEVVPVLGGMESLADSARLGIYLDRLRARGSFAAPGFDRPEGVVLFHVASRHTYKVLLEGDDVPKGAVS